jgi:hypothetical protein
MKSEWLAIEKELPGFGGLSKDSSGDARVYLKNLADSDASRRVLASHGRPLPRHVRFLQGDFAISELASWSEALMRKILSPGIGMELIDDEALNRVRIAVYSWHPEASMLAQARELGIPESAITFNVRYVLVDTEYTGYRRDSAVAKPAGVSFTMGGDTWATLGDSLHIWLHVRNQTDSVLRIDLDGLYSAFILVLKDPTGHVIWDWVHGTVIGDAPTTVPIPPHGERALTTTWGLVDSKGNPVPPGKHVVHGRLLLFRRCGVCVVDADNSPLNVVIRPKK